MNKGIDPRILEKVKEKTKTKYFPRRGEKFTEVEKKIAKRTRQQKQSETRKSVGFKPTSKKNKNKPAQVNQREEQVKTKQTSSKPERDKIVVSHIDHGIRNIIKKARDSRGGLNMVANKKNMAIKFGIIGLGQGGCRIAAEFSKYGYTVMAINTSEQDMADNQAPETNKLLIGKTSGAGKDIAIGKNVFETYRATITSKFREVFRKDDKPEHIMLTVGLGGGTGSGGLVPMIETLKELGYNGKIGIIATLPLETEDSTTKRNCLKILDKLGEYSNKQEIAPLIIVDNDKIEKHHKGLSTREFWDVANREFIELFHMFNILAKKSSAHVSFDPMDYRKLITTPHYMIYGSTLITNYKNEQAMIDAVRNNLTNGLLAEGFDLASARSAGAIIASSRDILDNIPRSTLEAVFDTVHELLVSGTVFKGVYELPSSDERPITSVTLFTMYTGMDLPKERIMELVEQIKKGDSAEEQKVVEKKETVSDLLNLMDEDLE